MNDSFLLSIFTDVNVRSVVFGSALLGATAGAIGCFALLRRRALLGDALAHAALPGVVLGFLISGGKFPLALLLGAMATAWLGALAVDLITKHSKLKEDAAVAISLSSFFAIGIVGLTIVQKHGAASQTGLEHFLFGHAASMMPSDVLQISILSVFSLTVLAIFFKEFKAISFDSGFTQALGFPVSALNIALTTLIVIAVVIGLQAVGIVLMAAMIITPAGSARFWTDKLSKMILLAAVIGLLSGISGALISLSAPRMPTGPWIVLAATFFFFISLLFAPKKGMLTRLVNYLQVRRQTHTENILKTFHSIREERPGERPVVTVADLHEKRHLTPSNMKRTLAQLVKSGLIEVRGDGYQLTASGITRAARIVKLHRLWEVYLSDYIHLPSDHVHRDAEQIEHVITPELETELEAFLNKPRTDPHGEPIPYPQERAV